MTAKWQKRQLQCALLQLFIGASLIQAVLYPLLAILDLDDGLIAVKMLLLMTVLPLGPLGLIVLVVGVVLLVKGIRGVRTLTS